MNEWMNTLYETSRFICENCIVIWILYSITRAHQFFSTILSFESPESMNIWTLKWNYMYPSFFKCSPETPRKQEKILFQPTTTAH